MSVYAPSVPEICSMFAQGSSCLGESIVDEPVSGLMENSSLLHCLQLDSASDGRKLFNTITLSRCTVNESKAWTSLA